MIERLLGLATLVLVIGATGCADEMEDDESVSANSEQALTAGCATCDWVATKSMRTVQYEDTVATVRRKIGAPGRIQRGDGWMTYVYGKTDFTFERKHGEWQVATMGTKDPLIVSRGRGIHVGSTEKEAKEAYPNLHCYVIDGLDFCSLRDNGKITELEFRHGSVSLIEHF